MIFAKEKVQAVSVPWFRYHKTKRARRLGPGLNSPSLGLFQLHKGLVLLPDRRYLARILCSSSFLRSSSASLLTSRVRAICCSISSLRRRSASSLRQPSHRTFKPGLKMIPTPGIRVEIIDYAAKVTSKKAHDSAVQLHLQSNCSGDSGEATIGQF